MTVTSDINAAQKAGAEIFTFGTVPVSPHTTHARALHPMIDAMAQRSKHWIFEGLLIQHGLTNTQALWTVQRVGLTQQLDDLDCTDATLLKDTSFYQIVESGETLFVLLPGAPEFKC